ncbi:hypothetical protein D1831_03750 [Lactiplantibacillus garii]|uniref:Uncharacterized protein n=1 Tax=Lactiplantibacillus garii TaxID=2306423 RepID=A0A3R8QSJ3_9LACO|nr:hypothetical protein [Lactiplantibacillus garii]RRK11204.1 hypothetical protein D1831_03750 [Lactiplantibacillus garii]
MWFWHRKQSKQLTAPVRGHHVPLSSHSSLLLAIHPTDLAVYAPLNGEVRALTSSSLRLVGLDGQTYRLALSTNTGYFNWQVRVGDSVSPLNLLGTLSQKLPTNAVVTCERLSTKQRTRLNQPAYAVNY